MAQQIAVRIPEEDLARIDAAVKRGRFPSRAAAVRAGLELLLKVEREREIAEEYRRAYSVSPQDDWVGEVGLALGAALIAQDREEVNRRS